MQTLCQYVILQSLQRRISVEQKVHTHNTLILLELTGLKPSEVQAIEDETLDATILFQKNKPLSFFY